MYVVYIKITKFTTTLRHTTVSPYLGPTRSRPGALLGQQRSCGCLQRQSFPQRLQMWFGVVRYSLVRVE